MFFISVLTDLNDLKSENMDNFSEAMKVMVYMNGN
jgi:hypothetical protein